MSHREKIRKQLQTALKTTGLDATALAKAAGVSHTTLTRFLNNPHYMSTPNSTTLAKIDAAVARFGADNQADSGPALGGVLLRVDSTQDAEEADLLRAWRRLSHKNKVVVAQLIESLVDAGNTAGADHETPLNRNLS